MKALFISLIIMAGLGGYFIAARTKNQALNAAIAAQAAQSQREKEELENSLKSGRQRPSIQPVTQPGNAPRASTSPAASNPEETLARLIAIRVPPGAQGTWAIRKVVHELENLAEAGPAAVPVIVDFLNKFQDIDYVVRGEDESPEQPDTPGVSTPAADGMPAAPAAQATQGGAAAQNAERERRERIDRLGGMAGLGSLLGDTFRPSRRVRLDFTYPPSLRIGLFDVLRQIGGAEAESALATALTSTARPVEVAYLAKTLQELQPNVYKDQSVNSAKELLMEPQVATANRLDRDGKSYLYHVLSMYNDTSFLSMAQGIVVTPDGRLDRNTFDYLRGLNEQGIPGLMQAYNDSRLLADQSVPGRLRSMALMRLIREDDDPNLAAQRIPIVQQAKAMSGDPDIQRAADATIAGLTKIQQGERPDMRDFMRGMAGSNDADRQRGRTGATEQRPERTIRRTE
jgi:hypothetical protein